jgi:uncharacterized membrane protein
VDIYTFLKTLHIVSASLLLGTGLGIAFFLWMAHRGGEVHTIAAVSRLVVLADWCFTAPAVVIQFVSGILLAHMGGIPLTVRWLSISLGLFVLIGACWLPVVYLQIRIRKMAIDAARTGGALPDTYYRAMRAWFWLGWPAFVSVVVIIYLMVSKPV